MGPFPRKDEGPKAHSRGINNQADAMTKIPDISTDSPTVILFVLAAVFFLAGILCEQGRRFLPIDCILYWIGFFLFLALGIFFGLFSDR